MRFLIVLFFMSYKICYAENFNKQIIIDLENITAEKAIDMIHSFSKFNQNNYLHYDISLLSKEQQKECLDYYKDPHKCSSEYLFVSGYAESTCDEKLLYVKESCGSSGCTYKFFDNENLGACE